MRYSGLWSMAIGACFALAASAAQAGGIKPDRPRQLATCTAIRDARKLDAPLRRPGITARRCGIAPRAWFAVLSDDAVSWPVVRNAPQPPVSLEDPVARRQWFAGASPLRTNATRDALVVLRRGQHAPQTAYYSAAADRADAPGRITAFVVVRIRPQPCLLGVVRDAKEARRLAMDGTSDCEPPVGRQ